jgi:sister chromatid cohesion protein PDS5
VIDEDEENVVSNLNLAIQRVAGLSPIIFFPLKVSSTLTLIGLYPDPQRAIEDLTTFAKLNEGRLYKLLRACMDPQTDIKTVAKSSVSLLPNQSFSNHLHLI